MAKFVNNVFVGKGVAPADIDTLNVGDVTIVDEKDAKPTATSKQIRVVKVTGKRDIILPDGTTKTISIVKSTELLNKNEIVNDEIVLFPYKAAVEKEMVIDFTSVTFPTNSNRIMLRILMKDVEGTKTQITKTFDFVAQTFTATAVAEGLAKKVNRFYGDIILATAAAGKLTLKARPAKTYPGTEVYSEYVQNDFTASVCATMINVAVEQIELPGVSITTSNNANKGSGTPALVRDRERSALPYSGNMSFTHFPYMEPKLTVNMDKTYDSITFAYNKVYRSVEEQYLQSAPRSIEIYVEAGTGAALKTILSGFYNPVVENSGG